MGGSLFDDDDIAGLCTAESGADFSPDSVYRYALWRVWEPRSIKGNVAVFGVNPSTADEIKNDMTINKCIGFAKRWGYGGLYMLNLYAFVATDPLEMVQSDDPVGHRNDSSIAEYLANCNIGLAVAAWGGSIPLRYRPRIQWQSRITTVLAMAGPPVYCLGRTSDGSPRHPSRLGYDTPLEVFYDGTPPPDARRE